MLRVTSTLPPSAAYPPKICLRFAHLLFRAWVDKISQEAIHDTPAVGVEMAVDENSGAEVPAPVTPPLLEPLPEFFPGIPVPPPPAVPLQACAWEAGSSGDSRALDATPLQATTQQTPPSNESHLHPLPAGSLPKGMVAETGSSTCQGAWPSMGPWKLGELAPSLKHLADSTLRLLMAGSSSSSGDAITLRWGLLGQRGVVPWISTPKEEQLRLLLKINQAFEETFRREEVPFCWNTIKVQWGPGALWQGDQHRPGRTAILALGPEQS